MAGLAFGAAATMRTEAFAYVFVATAVVCVLLVARARRCGRPWWSGPRPASASVVVFGANACLETACSARRSVRPGGRRGPGRRRRCSARG